MNDENAVVILFNQISDKYRWHICLINFLHSKLIWLANNMNNLPHKYQNGCF